MKEKIRIGIIGTGGIAGQHMSAYMRRMEKFNDLEIVAGCDIVEGKAEKFFKSRKFENVNCYTSHEEMLDIIRRTSQLDFAFAYAFLFSTRLNTMTPNTRESDPNIASFYEKNLSAMRTTMEEIIETFGDLG